MNEFVGKTAVITGGNGGIGKAIAIAFAQAGAFVVILGRNVEKGAAALAELQAIGSAAFHAVDLSRAEEIETCLANYKQIDVLVNNAGVFAPKPFFMC